MKVFRYSFPTVLNEVANKVVPASIKTVYYLLFKVLKTFYIVVALLQRLH